MKKTKSLRLQSLKCVITFGNNDDITMKHVTCNNVHGSDIVNIVKQCLPAIQKQCDFQNVLTTLSSVMDTPLRQENLLYDIPPLHLKIASSHANIDNDDNCTMCVGNAQVIICEDTHSNHELVFGNDEANNNKNLLDTNIPCLHLKHRFKHGYACTLTALLCQTQSPSEKVDSYSIEHFLASTKSIMNINDKLCALKRRAVTHYAKHENDRQLSHYEKRQFVLKKHVSSFLDMSLSVKLNEANFISTPLFYQCSNVIPYKDSSHEHALLLSLFF